MIVVYNFERKWVIKQIITMVLLSQFMAKIFSGSSSNKNWVVVLTHKQSLDWTYGMYVSF